MTERKWHKVKRFRAGIFGGSVMAVDATDYDSLAKTADALYEALDALMTDPNFSVSIGGNPNAVAKLMLKCNAALDLARVEQDEMSKTGGSNGI